MQRQVSHVSQVSFFGWRIQCVGPIFFQSHQGLCCGETFRDTESATRRAWLGGQQGRVFRSHEATEWRTEQEFVENEKLCRNMFPVFRHD